MAEHPPTPESEVKKATEAEALEPIPPDTREAILNYVEGLKLIQGAKTSAQEVSTEHRPRVYAAIATTEAHGGIDPSRTIETAAALSASIEHDTLRARAYLDVARAEVQIGRDPTKTLAEAMKVIESEDAKFGYRASQYGEDDIPIIYARAGMFEKAKVALEQLLSIGPRVDRVYRIKVYAKIAAMESQAGKDPTASFEIAKTEADQIAQHGYDSGYRDYTYRDIAIEKIRAGQIDEAKTIAETFENGAKSLHRDDVFVEIASAEAQRGHFTEALQAAEEIKADIHRQVRGLLNVAYAKTEAGKDPTEIIERAKAILAADEEQYGWGGSDPRRGSRCKIVIAEARSGRVAEARKLADEFQLDIKRQYHDQDAYREIALAELRTGNLERAKALARELSHHPWHAWRVAEEVARVESRAGRISEARAFAEEVKAPSSDVFEHIALGQIDAAAKKLQISRSNVPLTPEAQTALLTVAGTQNDREVLQALGAIASPETQERFLTALPSDVASRIRHHLDYGRTVALEITTEEEKGIRARTRRDLIAFLKSAAGAEETASLRPEFKLIVRTLYNLGSDAAKATLLEAARGAPEGLENPLFARLLHTLIDADTPKGHDLAVQIIGDERLPRHLTWLLTKKLVGVGYLDHRLIEYLKESRDAQEPKTASETVELENQDLHLLRLIINRLGINPDVEVIKLIREKVWRDAEGHPIATREHPDAIVDRIQEMKARFERMEDRDELIRTLARDQEESTTFYVLYGGRVHFALVNSYNSEKFHTILRVTDQLRYHQGPEREWQNALAGAGYPATETQEVLARLHAGKFPFSGERTWSVRLDVSDTATLEAVERESRGLFGRDQIGALLKRIAYPELLGKAGDLESIQRLEAARGLGELGTIFGAIEAQHPEFLDEVERRFTAAWKKIGEKGVLNLALRAVLREEENAVDLTEMTKTLEHHRKALAQAVRQQFKAKSIDKLVRDERLQIIEGKSRGKLLRYMVEAMIGGEGLPEEVKRLFAEWESHLEGVFQKYDELRVQTETRGAGKREKTVTLRYLDKREDLIPALRFADSAQCCFTSTQYRIEGYNVGNAEWIARLWKDPLSFVFMVEDNAPDAEHREAIGFVFGSFGLNERHEPVVLLNGVYMQSGKTDLAVQSILKTIEDRFSRPMRAAEQYVATQYGGQARLSREYTNEQRRVRRLRALAAPDGSPETKVYDDLGLMPNTEGESSVIVWHKKI